MAKLLSNLRSDTRMLLDESSPSDFTNVQVDAAINYAYQEMVTAVQDVYEDYYVSTAQISTVADQQEYTVTDSAVDFWKMRRVEINYDVSNTNSSPERALPITLDDVDRDLGNTTINQTPQRTPAYYIRDHSTGTKLGFIPVPDNTGSNAIKIWYFYTVSDLSAVGDAPDIPYPDRYARLISYGATGDLLRKGQQEEEAALRYRAEFQMGLEKMKQELEDRRADDVRGVTDTAGLDTDFTS